MQSRLENLRQLESGIITDPTHLNLSQNFNLRPYKLTSNENDDHQIHLRFSEEENLKIMLYKVVLDLSNFYKIREFIVDDRHFILPYIVGKKKLREHLKNTFNLLDEDS